MATRKKLEIDGSPVIVQSAYEDSEGKNIPNTYLKKDGYSADAGVGYADQAKTIKAVSDESGTTQTAPFISQGTATDNNTSPVDSSPIAEIKYKQGNTAIVNQLIDTSYSNSNVSYTNRYLTVNNVSGGNTYRQLSTDRNFIANHKYLVLLEKVDFSSGMTPGQTYFLVANIATNISSSSIVTATSNYTGAIGLVFGGGSPENSYYKAYISIHDLTQRYGSNDNIPQDLLDHPENAARYGITSDIAYNTGELVNSNGRYLECGQSRNVWDEQANFSGTTLSSTNYTMVIPNTAYRLKSPKDATVSYYDKNKTLLSTASVTKDTNFTTPANCIFIKFEIATYGSSYANDITISLYYTTGDSYDKYFPYVPPITYDTGTEVLRSAGSVRDRKEQSGLITRRVGVYTFTGEETWNSYGNSYKTGSILTGSAIAKTLEANVVPNLLSDTGLIGVSRNDIYNAVAGILVDNQSIYITDTTNLTGKTVYYELATPTTEQGTAFSENIEINDYAYMSWKDTDSDLVEIPQGCKIFYPADYVLLMDSLNTLLNGDVDKIFTRYKHTIDLRAESTDHIDLVFYFISSDATKIEGASGLTFLTANYKFMQVDGLDGVNGQKIVGIYLWSGTTLQLLEVDGNDNISFVTYNDITIAGTPSDSVAEI